MRPKIGTTHTANPIGCRLGEEKPCETCVFQYHYMAEPLIRGPRGYESRVAYMETGPYYQQVLSNPDGSFTVARTMWWDPNVVILA